MATKRESSNLAGRGRNKRTSGVDRIVGQKLRLRRTILQMSQHDLAQKIGITSQQLQKYEAGHNRVSAARLYQLAEELKVPLPWFFAEATSEAASPVPATAAEEPTADDATRRTGAPEDDIIRLLTHYQRISNPEIRRILVMLACFLSSRGD
jgi:transcriptional regulator with XRE-family HTH domain